MPIITIIVVLVVIGLIMWLINAHVPMQATLKKILNIVVVIIVIIWLLQVTGIWAMLSGARVG